MRKMEEENDEENDKYINGEDAGADDGLGEALEVVQVVLGEGASLGGEEEESRSGRVAG